MTAWPTAAELAGLPGLPATERGVRTLARRAGWSRRKRIGRGGAWEYAPAALPPAARAALCSGGSEAARARLAADMTARGLHAASQAGLAAFAALDDGQRARAEAYGIIVKSYLALARERQIGFGAARETFATEYRDGRIDVPDWVRESIDSVSVVTLWRWETRLRRYGIVGLADGRRRSGRKGAIDADAEVRDLIVGLIAATPHASAKHAMRACRARFACEPGRVPSTRTVQRFMANWRDENKQLFAMISSPDSWRSKYQAAGGKADEGVVRLNQRWEMDSTPFDLKLVDGSRHAVIGCIDVWPRRVKFLLSRTSNSVAIAALLRRCLMDWGVPELVKTDQGADYVSNHVAGVLAALDIEHDKCPAFTPELKPFIERAFGTLLHDMVELLPGFIGHNVAERQAIRDRRSFAQRMMKKGGVVETGMTAHEVQAFLDRWADHVYALDPHRGLGGKTPLQRAAEWPHPPSAITNPRALDILLAEAPGDGGWRVVGKKGIRAGGLIYDHPALGGLEGKRVKVRYDEADVGRIFVFAEDGAWVGIAEAPEITGISRRAVSAHRKARQKKDVRAAVKEAKATAGRARVQDIVREIMDHGAAEADRVVAFPRAGTPHETDALMEAARAAADDGPRVARPLTAEEREKGDAAWRELTAKDEPDNVTRLPARTPAGERPFFADDREYALWIMDNPREADGDDRAWLTEEMRKINFRLWVGREWQDKDDRGIEAREGT